MSRRAVLLALVPLAFGCSSPGGEGGPGTTPPPGDTGGFLPVGDAGTDGVTGDDTGPGKPDIDNGLVSCAEGEACPAATPYCGVAGFCLECLGDEQCPEGSACENGSCVSLTCAPGATECSGNTLLTCKADGTGWDSFFCVGGQCVNGACKGCEPNKLVCQGDSVVLQCAADGSGFSPYVQCPAEKVCVEGECKTCRPGNRRCVEGDVAQACSNAGEWELAEDCGSQGLTCAAGACISPCAADLKFKSNSGCDYWAVDLDNHWDAQDSPFAIIVSNLSDKAAKVTITVKDGEASPPTQVAEKNVGAGQLEIFNLPPRQPAGTKIGWLGYRVQSTSPIIAYQFNPLDNVDVFSNDASLLIPVNTYGQEYVAVSTPQFIGGGPDVPLLGSCASVCNGIPGGTCIDDGSGTGTQVCLAPYRGTLTVVAPKAATKVTIRPTARTLAGGGVPAMDPYKDYELTLEPYQVLNIKTDADQGDLTGTLVTADKPVAVFSGHEAAVSNDRCCADHLEQQLFPTNTWGTKYVATKAYPRGVEKDYWRIVAVEDGTQVSFDPPVHAAATLNRGQFLALATTKDFVVSADRPIMVAQILASSREILTVNELDPCTSDAGCHPGYECLPVSLLQSACFPPECVEPGKPQGCPSGHTCTCFDPATCYCQAVGDPALILMAPVGQFRKDYVFLSPNKYQDDFVNIIAPTDATVTLDNFNLPAGNFEAIPGTGYKVARVKVQDGVHKLNASLPVGVVAYGFDKDVSYGYTAGLNLSDL